MTSHEASVPLVGIWWDAVGWQGGSDLVVLAHPIAATSSGTRFIDSDLNHFEEWDRIASRLNRSSEEEYFVVPRGRVLYRKTNRVGLIYHGTATSETRLKTIAAAFGYVQWENRLDDHYEMDSGGLDELFGLD